MKEVDYRLIGACGIYCGNCDVLRACQEDDENPKKSIAELVSKEIGIEVKPETIRCDGCWGDTSLRFRQDCRIRNCAEEKGMHSCGECRGFPCRMIDEFHDWGKKTYKFREYQNARGNLVKIREIGIENWLKKEQE